MSLTNAEKQRQHAAKHKALLGEVGDLIDAFLSAVDRGGADRATRDELGRIDPALDLRAAVCELRDLLGRKRVILCGREGEKS